MEKIRVAPWLSVLGFGNTPLAFVAHTDAQIRRIHGVPRYAFFAADGCLEGHMPCRDVVIARQLGAFHISPVVLQAMWSFNGQDI